MNRVRNGAAYTYQPVPMDRISPACTATEGQRVRVKNMHGCPPCNTMGHAHIVDAQSGDFLGLCHVNSLVR